MQRRLLSFLSFLPFLLGALALIASAAPLRRAEAGPRLSFEPPALELPASGGERAVTLRNTGDAPLRLRAAFLSPDAAGFHVESPGERVLLPGAATTVGVRFTPGPRPRDATGALLVYSDDPRGLDDPRSPEPDPVLGMPLRAGGTSSGLFLFVPPLLGALLVLLLRRRGGRLVALGAAAASLCAAAWLVHRFEPGLTVRDGGYGVQLLLHRALFGAGIELFIGFDGLSLPLAALVTLWGVVAASGPAFTEERDGSPAWGLLLLGGTLLAVAALDVALLLLGWALALLGAAGACARGRRRAPVLVACLSLGLLTAGLAIAALRSLPAVGVDGTFVAHTTDLIKLSYLNYFGDQRIGGLRLDMALWLLLLAGGLLPPLALLLLPEAGRGRRLVLSVPLLVLALYAVLRLAGGLFPQAAIKGMRWLGGAGLFGLLLLTLRALQARTLQAMLAPLLVAQLLATALGMAAGTQAGLLAALLGLWRYGLGALILGASGPGTAGSGMSRGERALRLGATLLLLGAPGLLGFPASILLIYGAAPTQRLATVVLLAVLLVVTARAVPKIFYEEPGSALREPAAQPGAPFSVRLVLLVVAVLLGVWPQLLITLSIGWVNDFLSHTVGHLGAAALALLS